MVLPQEEIQCIQWTAESESVIVPVLRKSLCEASQD